MTKKSFKNNPALNFISPAKTPAAPEEAPGCPAARLTPDKGGRPMKLNPLFIETKSKRVQLLMQPSLHGRLREAAARRGQSLNDLIHTILADWPGTEA